MKLFAKHTALLGAAIIGLIAAGCNSSEPEKQTAVAEPYKLNQTLYYGGDILTMEGGSPQYIEALVEREGQIIFTGSKAQALKTFDSKAKLYDLEGNTLLPGFIDGHGHIANVGFISVMANLLPPPDGPGANYDSLVETTKNWIGSENGKTLVGKFGWVLGNGYDDSQLAEKLHPTRQVLDKVSTEYPVFIIHQSGHLGVVNSKGLEILGLTKDSIDPPGGVIRRDAEGHPTGVLEENAMFAALMPIIGAGDAELTAKTLQMGQMEYAKRGYTTAQEGRAMPGSIASLAAAADDGRLFLDVVSYADIAVPGNDAALGTKYYSRDQSYINNYRIGGVKLTLDGSPQGKTAWFTRPYHVAPEGKDESYAGYPVFEDEKAFALISRAVENKWQILVHSNGDAAIDQFIGGLDAAIDTFGKDDLRPVLIHGQTLRKDQIPELKTLGVYPSLFPMHTFYWGDWHADSVLGFPRADYISPTRDVVDAGMTLTSHHDAPVTFPNSMRVLDATVNRVTRSGRVLGPDQRLTPYEGLKALTDWAAVQYFEEGRKGTLTKGKRADMVILAQNPLKIDPLTIKDIQVVETIKDGKPVFKQ